MAKHAIEGACGIVITPGETYLVSEQGIRRLADAGDDLAFLSRRQFVERDEVLETFDSWIHGNLPTARFGRWITTADTNDKNPPPDEKSWQSFYDALNVKISAMWESKEYAAASEKIWRASPEYREDDH